MLKKLVLSCLAASAFFPSLAHAGYIFITQDQTSVNIYGGDYEGGLQANGQDIDTILDGSPYTGSPLTVSLGTPINFSGEIVDDGGTVAGQQQIYVLPFAGANFAISDLSLTNTASSFLAFPAGEQDGYMISGTYNSGEDISVPSGASTVVLGGSANFNTPFSSNTLTVPEPSTWALLGGGCLLFVLGVRRRCGSGAA